MKKAISLILALVMCLGLFACGDNQTNNTAPTTEAPPEAIEIDQLYEDLSNGAKCQLNVGKQVTVFGTIYEINANNCYIEPIEYPNESISMVMTTEELAKLSTNQFIAVTGIVESYKGDHYAHRGHKVRYDVSATAILDDKEMDAIFSEMIKNNFENGKYEDAWSFRESLYILYDYMASRGDSYTPLNNGDLKNYLYGTWECGYYKYLYPTHMEESIFLTFLVTYNEDGSAEYSPQTSYPDDWSVDEEGLDTFVYNANKNVYVLSDDVFIYSQYVFVRQK